MAETLRGADRDRLERSCSAREDSIRLGAGAPGLERAEVRFATCRFSPHRHDTYAIGITTAGVQTFRYRGRRHICLPGQLHFLYPDETHDGGPATDAGFAYRILYVEPELAARGARRPPAPVRRRPRSGGERGDARAGAAPRPRSTTRSATSAGPRRPPRSPPRSSLWAVARRPRGRSTSRPSAASATTSEPTRASRRRRRRSSGSPGSTGMRSRASSAGRTARAPTGTGPCGGSHLRGRRSRAGCRSRARLQMRASPTRAT